MKKLISLLLVLLTMLSASITVFAETYNNVGEYEADVTGVYVAGNEGSGTVFCVDIEWANMTFTYHAQKDPVWDPVNHIYSEPVAAWWEGEGSITVTNHSNTLISATPTFEATDGYDSVALTFSPAALHLASSEFMEFGENQTGEITVTPSGSLPENTNGVIGAVKIRIEENTENITTADAQALLDNISTLLKAMLSAQSQSDPDSIYYSSSFSNALGRLQTGDLLLSNALNNNENVDQDDLNQQYAVARERYYSTLSFWNSLNAQ